MTRVGLPDIPSSRVGTSRTQYVRILLVADMRDPHAINWVSGLLDDGQTPICISSRRLGDYRSMLPLRVKNRIVHEPKEALSRAREAVTEVRPALVLVRRVVRGGRVIDDDGSPPRVEGTGRLEVPLELGIARALARVVTRTASRLQPDVVHALRIPYEGIAASMATFSAPLALSLWGSDLTRQASSSPRLARATQTALRHARGVHADCQRDLELATRWGASPGIPLIRAAGNMGVRQELFSQNRPRSRRRLVVFPRGASPSVNHGALLKATAALVQRHPDVTFVGVRLKGDALAESVRRVISRPEQLVLTANLRPQELADLMREAIAVVSPSTGDGTPNSLLEGMACGAVPIAGDIDSLRELLNDSLPECLIDPLDQGAIERSIDGIITAPESLWAAKSELARSIARDEWSRTVTTARVRDWYRQVIDRSRETT